MALERALILDRLSKVDVPGGGDLLNSFAAALVTSTAITLAWHAIDKSFNNHKISPFNYSSLSRVKPYR